MTLPMMDGNRLHQRTMRTIFEDEEDSEEDQELIHSSLTLTEISNRRQCWILMLLFVVICYLSSAGHKLSNNGNTLGIHVESKAYGTHLPSNKELPEELKSPKVASQKGVVVGHRLKEEEAPLNYRFPSELKGTGRNIDGPYEDPPFTVDEAPPDMSRFPKVAQKQTLIPPAVWDDSYRSLDDRNPQSLPVFLPWTKSEGSTIRDIIMYCHAKVIAFDDVIVLDERDRDMELRVMQTQKGDLDGGYEIGLYANVDLTTESGIQRARVMGLVESGLVEVIFTPLLYESSILFAGGGSVGDSGGNDMDRIKGKIFAFFRHPVHRAIEMFKSMVRSSELEKQHEASLEAYIGVLGDNIMVRSLARVPESKAVQKEDLEFAMALVSEKILVGLHERMEESLERFEQYFGWRYTLHPERQEACRNTMLWKSTRFQSEADLENDEVLVNDFSSRQSYQVLHKRNNMDLHLYNYARELFHHQGALVQNVDAKNRLLNATCSICAINSTV